MKPLKQTTFFFIAIVFITIAACKKYPDGPLISFNSKTQRLCKDWGVASFSVNGYDSTAFLKSQPFYGTYKFERPEKDNPGRFIYSALNHYYDGIGDWDFSNDKTKVSVSCDNVSLYGGHLGPYRANYIIWDIMRLGEKDIWLKTIYNGKEYFVKFK